LHNLTTTLAGTFHSVNQSTSDNFVPWRYIPPANVRIMRNILCSAVCKLWRTDQSILSVIFPITHCATRTPVPPLSMVMPVSCSWATGPLAANQFPLQATAQY